MYTLLILGFSYEVIGTTGDTVTDTNCSSSVVLPGGTVNLIYLIHYLIVCLLLLLSGDVELNPGPTINDQPDIFLLLQWLEPLVDWKSFGLNLPGITQQDIVTIDHLNVHTKEKKVLLCTKWLNAFPSQVTWRDVLDALTRIEEDTIAQTIIEQLKVYDGGI